MLHIASLLSLLVLLANIVLSSPSSASVPISGRATLTHYDLPLNYIASCGCVPASTHYPTAAINSMAYGSNNSYGPTCGVCFRLELESTPRSPPPPDGNGVNFNTSSQNIAPSVVVKITDDCPLGGDWCTQTEDYPINSLGSHIHFDLAWPSMAISDTFFPTDQGRDYGVWWTSYQVVDCNQWSGYTDKQAWGSDWAQQSSACCPLRPSNSNMSSSSADVEDSSSNSAFDSYKSQANLQYCPSYSNQVSLGLSADAMTSQVPNTSNILSKVEDNIANSAWTLSPYGLFWN